jgi:hypothetical protein
MKSSQKQKRAREQEIEEQEQVTKKSKEVVRYSTEEVNETYCESKPKNIILGKDKYMKMDITGYENLNIILPILSTGQTNINGIKAEISLSLIRLQTINVVYRGLCSLNDNKITSNFVKRDVYKFILNLPKKSEPPEVVDFTDLYLNPNSFTRDQLGNKDMKLMDLNILGTISFLEKCKTQIVRNGPAFKTIEDILNSFIVCSSGKEYLDVGQLYAIIEPNNNANNAIAFWNKQNITDRVNNFVQSMPQYQQAVDEKINIPQRPFFETYDSAAAPIAGKYFTTYTECTIPPEKDPSISRRITTNPGSIPFLYDNIYILYLSFLYNYIVNTSNLDYSLLGEQNTQIIRFIKEIPFNLYCYFDLFYMLLENDSNTNLIYNFYKNNIYYNQKYRLVNPFIHDLISSVFYFYVAQNEPNRRQNLITANLDPLCHDNKDSDNYRLLMMYNLIRKNNNQDEDPNKNPLLKEIIETFRTETYFPINNSTGKVELPQNINENIQKIKVEFIGKSKNIEEQSTSKTIIENLTSNFKPIEKQMFYVLSLYKWDGTENRLINRMLSTNCYVFNADIMGEPSKRILIGIGESIGVTGISQSDYIRTIISKSSQIAPYSISYDLIPDKGIDWSDIIAGKIGGKINIKAADIIPFFARCCCDLSIHNNFSLTVKDIPSITYGTSIFNITPVTLNDAASVTLIDSVVYIPEPVSISFGNEPNNQQTYKYTLDFNGDNLNSYEEYKRNLSGLKYYYNLQDFDSRYNTQKNFLDSFGIQFSDFYYILLRIYGIDFYTKEEFNNSITCFLNNYNDVLNRHVIDTPIPDLQYFMTSSETQIEPISFKKIYNENTSIFNEELKQNIEKGIYNRVQSFQTKYNKNPQTANKTEFINNPPIFQNLVIGVMNIIKYIYETKIPITPQSETSMNIDSNELKIKIQILVWLYDFILDMMKYFLIDDPHCSQSVPTFNIGTSEPTNQSTRKLKASEQIKPTGRSTRSMKAGGNYLLPKNDKIIPITSLIGPYGFYQKRLEDGSISIQPINSLEEQQNVWEMYGINVSMSTNKDVLEPGVQLKQLNPTQEGEIRRLIKQGLSKEQATIKVLGTQWQLKPSPGTFVSPPSQPKRMGIMDLKQESNPQGDVVMVTSTSSSGTQSSRSGGKITKKRKSKLKRKITFKKGSKHLKRRTRRK